jgi:hypothetical protein
MIGLMKSTLFRKKYLVPVVEAGATEDSLTFDRWSRDQVKVVKFKARLTLP